MTSPEPRSRATISIAARASQPGEQRSVSTTKPVARHGLGTSRPGSDAPADALAMDTLPATLAPTTARSIDFFAISPGVLVDETFLSEGTGVSIKTIRNWRSARTGPRPLRLGGLVRYRVGDITAWIDACSEATAGDSDSQA